MPASPDADHSAFLALSAQLTGFDEAELLATGVVGVHLDWLRAGFPDVLADLLEAWRGIADGAAVEAAVRRELLADPRLGPFARGVTTLWYTASWYPLPQEWADAYGGRAADTNTTLGAAWAEGLVWKAGLTHPTAAKATGYASWARPPAGAVDG